MREIRTSGSEGGRAYPSGRPALPTKMPLVVEKDGQRYSIDIADDAEGVDLVITKNEEEMK